MSDIERVKIECTLKLGKRVYVKNTILQGDDLTDDVLKEVERGNATVVARKPPLPPPVKEQNKPSAAVKVEPKAKKVKRVRKKPVAKKK